MKKKYLFLLLIVCVSLLFMGFENRNMDENTKVSTLKSSNDDNINENKLKTENSKLYAISFDAVWEIDKALNSDIKYISINTKTFKDFTEEDKRQLFDYIEEKYNVTMLDMSYDELKDEGYIKKERFRDGILFQVDKYHSYSSDSVSFEGTKYRSGLGAIGFTFEAKKENHKWELKKCERTWIA